MNADGKMRELGELLVNFVEKTFLPLLDRKTLDHLKAIEKWNHMKKLIIDHQPISLTHIENHVTQTTHFQPKTQSSLNYSPVNKGTLSMGCYSPAVGKGGLNFQISRQKKGQNRNRVINYSFGGKEEGQREEGQNLEEKDEEFESLLKTFKRVCTIVEGNDKRLRGVNPTLRL